MYEFASMARQHVVFTSPVGEQLCSGIQLGTGRKLNGEGTLCTLNFTFFSATRLGPSRQELSILSCI